MQCSLMYNFPEKDEEGSLKVRENVARMVDGHDVSAKIWNKCKKRQHLKTHRRLTEHTNITISRKSLAFSALFYYKHQVKISDVNVRPFSLYTKLTTCRSAKSAVW